VIPVAVGDGELDRERQQEQYRRAAVQLDGLESERWRQRRLSGLAQEPMLLIACGFRRNEGSQHVGRASHRSGPA
jgi:hypothetical protein